MPSYFLTVRFPLSVLGPEGEVSSADMPDSPSGAYEKQGHVFYETDSESVAEELAKLFRRVEPPSGPGLEPLAKSPPVFEVVSAAGLDLAQRVLYRQNIQLLESMAQCDGDPGIREDAGLPNDSRTVLLWEYYEQARQWEPLVRDELDVAHGKAKGFYLWWTWWDVCPQEPTADLNERFCFYRVDTEDVAARLCRAFGRCHGIDIRFGYTASEALDIDETARANTSIEKYRRGEYAGEDAVAHLFTDARQWEHALPTYLGSDPLHQEAADDERCAATHEGPGGSADIPRKSEPIIQGGNAQQPPHKAPGGKPEDARLEKARTPSAPETHSRAASKATMHRSNGLSKCDAAASGKDRVDVEFLRTISDEVHTLLGPSAPSANSARLRTQIVAAIECHDRYRETVRKWQKERDGDIKQIFKEQKQLLKEQNQLRQPTERSPREGWQWVDDLPAMLCDPHQSSLAHAIGEDLKRRGGGGAWVPADLLTPPCFPPNPMPGGNSSEDTDETVLMRCYVALAAVHDRLDAYEGRTRARLLGGLELPPLNVRTVSYDDRPYLMWGKGFERTSIEQALEAVRRDLAAGVPNTATRATDNPSSEQTDGGTSGQGPPGNSAAVAQGQQSLEMSPQDRRNSALLALMLFAQAYYKFLECTISMASWCGALDVELNQSYLWIVNSLTSLLKNNKDLSDFPLKFEPMFSDLYPSTIQDLEWENMVAPEAERFLSTVQQYVYSKGAHDPEKGSPVWIFVEMLRPQVVSAIDKAIAYNARMRQVCRKILGSADQGSTDRSKTDASRAGDQARRTNTTNMGSTQQTPGAQSAVAAGSPDIPRKSEPTSPGGNAQQPPQKVAGGKVEEGHPSTAKGSERRKSKTRVGLADKRHKRTVCTLARHIEQRLLAIDMAESRGFKVDVHTRADIHTLVLGLKNLDQREVAAQIEAKFRTFCRQAKVHRDTGTWFDEDPSEDSEEALESAERSFEEAQSRLIAAVKSVEILLCSTPARSKAVGHVSFARRRAGDTPNSRGPQPAADRRESPPDVVRPSGETIVNLKQNADGFHWIVNGKDTGRVPKGTLTAWSRILFLHAGQDHLVAHAVFQAEMKAQSEDDYWQSHKQNRSKLKRLIPFEYDKERGMRLPKGYVKST